MTETPPPAPTPRSLTAEEQRLRRGPIGRAVAGVGAVPQRAPVGHGARGLQRQRRCVVVLHPRPGPVPGLPLGRGRPRRHLRRQAAALPGAGAVERARPDPEGAPVRPDQRRGQPRRGREGVLLLRRQPADPQLPALAVQVPARRVPVRRPRRHQPGPLPGRDGVRAASTPASSTTATTSTSRSSTPRPAPRTSSVASRCTTGRRRRRRRSTCCRRCGSATRGRGRPTSRSLASPGSTRRTPSCGPSTTSSATIYLHAEPRRRAAVLRERVERRAPVGRRRHARRYPKDGIDDHVVARRRHGQPGRRGDEGGGPRPPRGARRRAGDHVGPPDPRRARRAARAVRRRRRRDRRAARRGRRVLRRHHAAVGRRRRAERSCARRWPGCSGRSSATTSTSTSGCASARPIRCARRRGAAPATSRGSTWSTTTSSRCPTSGSTRGTRPGTSPSTASRWPWSTPTSPRASST